MKLSPAQEKVLERMHKGDSLIGFETGGPTIHGNNTSRTAYRLRMPHHNSVTVSASTIRALYKRKLITGSLVGVGRGAYTLTEKGLEYARSKFGEDTP